MADAKPASATSDAIKLFIGQVPRSFKESDLKEIMAEAGNITDLNIVRDRATKESKGCAFVLYSTREETDKAIELFHETRTLPGAKAALQVKFADGEQRKVDNKLFVGMLPKDVTPDALRSLFSEYGTVVEANVVRARDHVNRGSAFVKFERYSQAMAAIEALDGKHRMQPGSPPIVVKWAESEKEKSQRKASKAGGPPLLPGNFRHPMHAPHVGAPGGAAAAPHFATFFAPNAPPPSGAFYPPPPFNGAPPSYFALDYSGHYPPIPSAAPPHFNPPGVVLSDTYLTPSPAGGAPPPYHSENQPSSSAPHSGNTMAAAASATAVAAAVRQALSQREGPPGANVFVYNLPSEWKDNDLSTAFAEFGNVISSRVFVDKNTGASKGFGFLSFDASEAAEAAMAVMDGFMVAGNRLKVALKKGHAAAAAPY